MSSPSQSEVEDNIEQLDMNRIPSYNEEYENYIEQYDRENHGNPDNSFKFKRIFDGYHEVIEMITYMIQDTQFINERKQDIIRSLDNLISRKGEILENRLRECVDLCYCSEHDNLVSMCRCVCKCTYKLVSEQDKINKERNTSSSQKMNLCDKLKGINLPQYDGNDIYDFTSIGIIELETCLLHYKVQVETSIMEELERETKVEQREVLEQIYTMLQRI